MFVRKYFNKSSLTIQYVNNEGINAIIKDRKNLSLRLVFIGAEFAFPCLGFSETSTPKGRDIKNMINHIIKWTKIKDKLLI